MTLTKAFGNIERKLTEVSDPASGWLLTTTESSGHVAQLSKELGSNQEALAVDITPNMTYIGMVVHACYPSTWEAEVRQSESQHYPQLHREASIKYTRPRVKQTKITFWMMFSFFLSLQMHNLILTLSLPTVQSKTQFSHNFRPSEVSRKVRSVEIVTNSFVSPAEGTYPSSNATIHCNGSPLCSCPTIYGAPQG